MTESPPILSWEAVDAEMKFWDGALLGLHVTDTSVADWRNFLDAVTTAGIERSFACAGSPARWPPDVETRFKMIEAEPDWLLSLRHEGLLINCHFNWENEIALDVDPREFSDITHFASLVGFMRLIADSLGKPVILSGLLDTDYPMVRVEPRGHAATRRNAATDGQIDRSKALSN